MVLIPDPRPRLSLEHPNDKMRAETEGGLEEGTPSVGYYGYVRRTLEQMEAEFGENQNVWERSEAIVSLRAQMSLIETKDKIDIIVCLGLGSLQNSISSSRRTSHRQVAAILTIFDYLSKTPQPNLFREDTVLIPIQRPSIVYTVLRKIQHTQILIGSFYTPSISKLSMTPKVFYRSTKRLLCMELVDTPSSTI